MRVSGSVKPSRATVLCKEGIEALRRGDSAAAYHAFLQATRADATCLEGWVQLGDALSASKRFDLALACQRYTLALEDSAFTNLRYANALSQNRKYPEAKDYFWRSIKHDARLSKSWYGLAYIALMEGESENARKYIDRALSIDPDVPDIHYTSALIALMSGDWKKGFSADYEYRFQLKTTELPKDIPVWEGQDLTDKHLVVFFEQGFGDCFTFLRFLSFLPECGKVSLQIPKNVRRLFDYNFAEVYELYNAGTHVPKADYCISIASIPFRTMNAGREFTVECDPYLSAPDVFFKRTPGTRKSVGIVWKGDDRHPNDRLRSITPDVMVTSLLRPGIDLCSLQVADGIDGAFCGEMGILRDLGKHFSDFYDTACIIKQLDSVVSIDTGVVNLCGAMGKECHVLIPYAGVDWRWMQGDRSPWFPTVQLHRQQKHESWSDVLDRIVL